jgi:tRNA threonylcarbamoyladenosine biosynthesis protein TsaB
MSLILNIDTATATAHVSFAKDGRVIASLVNNQQKDHAAFIQTAIQQLAKEIAIALNALDAIAVTAGPGSYTGLRVGMASAKGLCYALNKPLIAINTLKVFTVAAQQQPEGKQKDILFCPMIDARRMEVFTALYDQQLNILLQPCAMILDDNSFLNELDKHKILFFGNGAAKWQTACSHLNASFTDVSNIIESMALIAQDYYQDERFADLAYSQPLYLKEFQDKI